MKAISFSDFGPANQVLKVSDWPTPAPGPGEVLVKLHTTGVNPSDVKKRAGGFPNLLDDGAALVKEREVLNPADHAAQLRDALCGRRGRACTALHRRGRFVATRQIDGCRSVVEVGE